MNNYSRFLDNRSCQDFSVFQNIIPVEHTFYSTFLCCQSLKQRQELVKDIKKTILNQHLFRDYL